MITPNNTILKINTSLEGNVSFHIQFNENVSGYSLTVFDVEKEIYSISNQQNEKEVIVSFNIDNPRIWSISSPNLYRYELKTNDEVVEGTFGIRKISTSGKYITLNNIPLFVRGYIRGIEAHDHKNNANLTEEEFYRKNIRTAKSFGFNFVRFHSQIPSETFFKVADEEGILVHIEMRPPHDIYNNLEEMVNSKSDFIDPNFILETVNKLYNHPSFAVYCLGNEIKNLKDSEEILRIGRTIKSLDPTRLYLDTCAWGENNRPLVDIDVQHMSYYFPFGKHADMYDDTNNLIVGDFNKGKQITFNVPLIAHEVCHYTALRDFANLKDKFLKNNVKAPWWVDEELKMIKEKGYEDRYPEMYKASKYFQLTCWKIAYEEMRSSKLLGGFFFLQFADTDKYENSNGVVDCFDDVIGVKPNDFIKFNGDLLLLTKLRKYNYFEKEEATFDICISRFDEMNLSTASLIVELGNQKRTIDDVNISNHDYYQIAKTTFKLPDVKVKTRLTLKLSLLSKNELLTTNEYHIWVYPKLKSFTYSEFINYEINNTVVTNSLEKALEAIKQDKNVVIVYRSDYTRHVLHKDMEKPNLSFKASWNRFKPVIWDRGTNFGGIVDSLENYGFNEPFLDIDLSILSEDSDKIILDDFPTKVMNLISGIDKCNRDRFDAYVGSFNLPELMYDRTLRDYSYLFALKVNNSKVVVNGLNLLGLDKNEPSSNYLANTLIRLAEEITIVNEASISLEDFANYLYNSSIKPIKERMMTQFWCLDDTPVESKEYWIESRKYLS